jgi:hypothetical protein
VRGSCSASLPRLSLLENHFEFSLHQASGQLRLQALDLRRQIQQVPSSLPGWKGPSIVHAVLQSRPFLLYRMVNNGGWAEVKSLSIPPSKRKKQGSQQSPNQIQGPSKAVSLSFSTEQHSSSNVNIEPPNGTKRLRLRWRATILHRLSHLQSQTAHIIIIEPQT